MNRNLIVAGLTAALIAVPVSLAGGESDDRRRDRAQTIAVIGDTPYGPESIAAFPAQIAQINADPHVERVIHVGDIKNGGSRCDDSYFQARLADFQRFQDPLVYTPGDNEWTDCHRLSNGGYLPTERLATIRRLFFPEPGETLGQNEADVRFQSNAYPENVLWREAGAVFGTVHVVGSSDNRAVWFGDRPSGPETRAEKALRSREYIKREAAALDWIDAIFDDAQRRRAAGVVVAMQADTYIGSAATDPAFDPLKAVLADRAERFGKPVLLLQGDSHRFVVDAPADMPANLVRLVVKGANEVPPEYVRLRVDAASARVFTCQRVVFGPGPVTACPGPLAP